MADARHSIGIEFRNLFKIFGRSTEEHIDAVRRGMSKTELNQKHALVLGLRDINIAMPGGSIQVIMGLSGSGKSTLIRHINRLIDPTAGEVLVGGVDVVRMSKPDLQQFRRHQTAMVFQKFALLPHRTVLENTAYGLEIQGLPRKKQVESAMGWIERVGLGGYQDRYPNQLSGGMQQRVGLARALSNDAPILLMDEAYSALDPLIRMDMQTVLLDLQKEIRKTVVFITHDLDEALRLGDQIAILRDGEVIQQGTSQDIVLRPADEYIANFVKEVNRARVIHVDAVMEPLRPDAAIGAPTLLTGTTIEDALRALAPQPDLDLIILEHGGKPIGRVNLRSLAGALMSPHVRQDARPEMAEASNGASAPPRSAAGAYRHEVSAAPPMAGHPII